MTIYKTEGIILRSYNLGEADRILSIYTRDFGKISAVAKGVRRSRSKLRGATQTLTYIDLVLYRGKNLDTITQCEAKEMFVAIREDLDRWAYATYITELLTAISLERQAQEGVFVLFLTALHLIANLEEPEIGVLFFTVQLLILLGYQPELGYCVACRTVELAGSAMALSGAMGGILCLDCTSLDGKAFRVQGGEIAAWRQIMRMEAQLLPRLKLSPILRSRLFQAHRYYLQYQLERQLKSVAFLKHLNSLDGDKSASFKGK